MAGLVLGVKVGDRAEYQKRIGPEEVELFAQATGDTNPLYLDESYAAGTRFNSPIAPAALLAGLVSAALSRKLSPNCCYVYLSQTLRCLQPVNLNATVTACLEVKAADVSRRVVTVQTDCFTEDGTHVLAGEVVLLLDPHPALVAKGHSA